MHTIGVFRKLPYRAKQNIALVVLLDADAILLLTHLLPLFPRIISHPVVMAYTLLVYVFLAYINASVMLGVAVAVAEAVSKGNVPASLHEIAEFFQTDMNNYILGGAGALLLTSLIFLVYSL